MVTSFFTKKYLLVLAVAPFIHLTTICSEKKPVTIQGTVRVAHGAHQNVRNGHEDITLAITTRVHETLKDFPLALFDGCNNGSVVRLPYPNATYDINHKSQPDGYVLELTCASNGKNKSFSEEFTNWIAYRAKMAAGPQ